MRVSRASRAARWGLTLGLLLSATSCVTAKTTTGASSSAQPAAQKPPVDFIGSVDLQPAHGPAGTEVNLSGRGLPASETLQVMWSTAKCRWRVKGKANEEYHGQECTEEQVPLGSSTSNAAGSFEMSFRVPEDYGFAHDVLLLDPKGVARNKASFNVDIQVDVTPTRGPVGTPITIEVKGMGWQTLENNRTVIYDNRYVGWMSAVSTRGTARAVIPAVGAPGKHEIQVARGAYTFPYLNPAQSPRPDIPVFHKTFTVTKGAPVLPQRIERQNPPAKPAGAVPDGSSRPAIATDLVSGPVSTRFSVVGAGFQSGETVTLAWFRIVGNRVGGQGWDERRISLGEARVGDNGSFEFETRIPGDVGGNHRIEAIVQGKTMAQTGVVVTPSASRLKPTSGPRGTDLQIHLTGVGWTETANIYTLVYDDAYLGYACGFNSQGDVVIPLKATGAAGWHLIDLYPAIYKGKETSGQQNFRIPQLTYAKDHPGEDLPAFHFAFRITG